MPQTIPALVQSDLNTHKILWAGAIEFAFGTGTYRFWDGLGDRSMNGNTWQGSGGLIRVEEIATNLRGEPEEVVIEMSSIPNTDLSPDALSQIETTNYKFRPVTIYTAYFSLTGGGLLDMVTEFVGYADTVHHSWIVGGEKTIRMHCESKALDLKRITGQIAGPEDQKDIDNADGFFDLAARSADIEIDWGVEEKVSSDRGRRSRRGRRR
jgi:hypothetical protein